MNNNMIMLGMLIFVAISTAAGVHAVNTNFNFVNIDILEDINITGSYYGDGSHLTGINASGDCNITDIWVNESGDTMTGNLDMSNNNITSISNLKLTNTTTEWRIYVDINGTLVWEVH